MSPPPWGLLRVGTRRRQRGVRELPIPAREVAHTWVVTGRRRGDTGFMPFTVSHAAAVLPFGARLSASALVIGAMTPDLPLFAPFLPYTTDMTHTLFGMFVTNIVVGFALFVLWHGFFARPADWFSPSAIRARLTPQQQPGLRRRLASPGQVLIVVFSLFLGGVTHQVLDLFTHDGTVLTSRFAVFQASVLGMPAYYFLQIALSVVGLVLMAAWAVRWYTDAPVSAVTRQPSRLGKIAARSAVVGAAAVAMIAAGAFVVSSGRSPVFVMSVAPVVAFALVSAVIAAIWHVLPDDR